MPLYLLLWPIWPQIALKVCLSAWLLPLDLLGRPER